MEKWRVLVLALSTSLNWGEEYFYFSFYLVKIVVLKLVSNSSSLNKGNQSLTAMVSGYPILISVDFYDFSSPFSP